MLTLPSLFKRSYFLFFSSLRMCSRIPVSICQFTATNDKESNFKIVQELVEESVAKSAKMVFLPEACDYISKDKQEFKKLAELLSGSLMSSYRNLAKTFNIWMSIGGFHEKHDESTIYNSHVVIDHKGEIKAIYRKIHLFDVSIPDKNIHLRESDNNASGSQILGPVETPIGLLGLAICYDLRFPEQSTLLRKLGSNIITFPSAFTSTTGKAHWEPLLRARAIENQCYVIAAAQYGKHNEKRTSYGHSMIVDPWGQIVAECPKFTEDTNTNQSIAVAEIDLNLVAKVRLEMPVFSHRRNDIYSLNLIGNREDIDDKSTYPLADKQIPGNTVFYVSKYCFAFTNIRCVVPGHVLVSTLRVAPRLQDLSQEELADLFQTTVKVSKVMETVHDAQSSTVCVQDGKFAGQTIADTKDRTLSKTLSLILRHKAKEENLVINKEGYMKVSDILQHKFFKEKYTVEDIKRVVLTNDKKRFTLRFDNEELEICANQGHSISGIEELSLTPLTETQPYDIIHGTYYINWETIKTEGISRRKRNHIHFAKGLPGNESVISGMRRNCQVYIYINLAFALANGILFYKSANEVILSPGNEKGIIGSENFLKVCNFRGQLLL